ncbi:MAG: hypothetical protein GX082_14885 [Clostridiaceae bacterium]|nr:hypothetical protein [Clostridiaceae bacterium]
MKRLILIVTIVLFLSSCSSLSFFEKPADTTRRVPSVPSKASEQIELTILLPYFENKNEYLEIFEELNVKSRDLLGITVRMLTEELSDKDPIRYKMHLYYPYYSEVLESSINAGLGPDIFFVLHTYSLFPARSHTLHQAVRSGYATDLTDYINNQTPYLLGFITEYPNLLPVMSIQDRIYGILTPPTYLNCYVLIVHKTIRDKIDVSGIYTLRDAINACIEIYNKGLLEDRDQIFFTWRYVINSIIEEAGYDMAFDESGHICTI